MERETFEQTTGQVAREAAVSQPTVRLYANLGLLPHIKASDGTRLFPANTAELVRDLCVKRLANRGRGAAA